MPRSELPRPRRWPILKTYRGEFIERLAMPMGGIGTGTVSLGGRGELRDWEMMNRPAKGFNPTMGGEYGGGQHVPAFFALWTKVGRAKPVARALEGPLPFHAYEGFAGSMSPGHGIPRFKAATFHAAYPLAQVELTDDDVPLKVRLEAFNPLIPGDEEASALPVLVLRYVLRNPGKTAVAAAVSGNIPNFINVSPDSIKRGWAGRPELDGGLGNRNDWRTGGQVKGLAMEGPQLTPFDPHWGTIALTTPTAGHVTYSESSRVSNWGGGLLTLWDDWSLDGAFEPAPPFPHQSDRWHRSASK